MVSLSPANSFLSLKNKSSSSTLASQSSPRFRIKSLYNRVFGKQTPSSKPISSLSSSSSSIYSLNVSFSSLNMRSQANRTTKNQNTQLPTPPESPLLNFSSSKSSTQANHIKNLNLSSSLSLHDKNEKSQPPRQSKTLKFVSTKTKNKLTKPNYASSNFLSSQPSNSNINSASSQIVVIPAKNLEEVYSHESYNATEASPSSSGLSRTLSNQTVCSEKCGHCSESMELSTKTPANQLKRSFSFKQKLKISHSMPSLFEISYSSSSSSSSSTSKSTSLNTITKKKTSKKAPKKMVTMTTMYPSRVEALKRERIIQQRTANLNLQTYSNGSDYHNHQIQQHQQIINQRLGRYDLGKQSLPLNNVTPQRYSSCEINHSGHNDKNKWFLPSLSFESIIEEDE